MKEREIYEEIGQRIKRFRKAAGRTQDELATRIGISRASIANIEAGRQNFLLHYLYEIAEVLELGTPVLLLPGSHEDVAPSTGMAKVPVPRKGLTDKQREEVMRVIGGGGADSRPSLIGGRR